MSEIRCFHCAQNYDNQLDYCPYCHAPSPAQQDKELAGKKNKFIWLFFGLVIFCGLMIVWLPRVFR